MRSFFYTLLLLLIASQVSYAKDKIPKEPTDRNDPNAILLSSDPNELLHNRWDAVIEILRNKEIEQEEKAKKISKIVTPIFDFRLMGKLALGRTHWPKLDVPQREKYTELFTDLLRNTYLEKISLYKDEDVVFKPIIKKSKTTISIPTELLHNEKKVAILYKLRKADKRWKIYDLEIQGVSVLLTYRSQFDEILRNGTVEDLLARLHKPPED